MFSRILLRSKLKVFHIAKYKFLVMGILFLVAPVQLHNEVSKGVRSLFRHRLGKQHLILSATRSPLINDPSLATISLGVTESILLEILSSHLNFTYEIQPPLDILSSGVLLPNGSWSGTSGQLQRREVDMCISTSAPAVAKSTVMDMSYPVVFADAAIIIPFPRENSKILWNTSTYTFTANITIGVTIVFIVLSTWLMHRFTNSGTNQSQNTLSYWSLYFVSVWTSQGITIKNASTPFRMVIIVSVSGLFIIGMVFTAAYTSYLTTPVFRKTLVNSVEDLANSKTVKTLLIKGSSTDEYIMASTDPIIKKIGNQMRRHPQRRILNALNVEDISTIVKDNIALVMVKSNAESVIQQSYKLNKECRVTLAEKTFYSRPQVFSYPKDSPLAAPIDYDILLMHEMGLIKYAEIRSTPVGHDRCSISAITKDRAETTVPMRLDQFYGPILMLFIGIAIACISLVLELVVFKWKNKSSKTQCRSADSGESDNSEENIDLSRTKSSAESINAQLSVGSNDSSKF